VGGSASTLARQAFQRQRLGPITARLLPAPHIKILWILNMVMCSERVPIAVWCGLDFSISSTTCDLPGGLTRVPDLRLVAHTHLLMDQGPGDFPRMLKLRGSETKWKC
jgi:hypothetical protein